MKSHTEYLTFQLPARMAFENITPKIEEIVRSSGIQEGLLLCNGNALVGVWKDRLIARLGPDEGEAAMREPHVRAFDITRRPMKNWVAVEPEGVEDEDQLKDWIERAVKFVKTLPRK